MTNSQPTLPSLKIEPAPVEGFEFEPIKGYPMLNWRGKRPFTSTYYYPAQHKETHGQAVDGWLNKVFWGDNLQVMSHMLKEFRSQVQLVYIDPPFDSKADYKKKVSLRGQQVSNDLNSFEEKQYTDIWTNDDYLQFMYERLIVIRELLADEGSIYLHCDWHKSHYLKSILDEIFGDNNFRNEIIWKRADSHSDSKGRYSTVTDHILLYVKNSKPIWNPQYTPLPEKTINDWYKNIEPETGRRYNLADCSSPHPRPNMMYTYKGVKCPPNGWRYTREKMESLDNAKRLYITDKTIKLKRYLDESKGVLLSNLWQDISQIRGYGTSREVVDYPTQKPESLIERIIKASSNPGDIVFDCFMGSGTTQAVAMKLGRRFIGADINLGAIQTTTKRLLQVAKELQAAPASPQSRMMLADPVEVDDEDEQAEAAPEPTTFYTGFELYNVNHYDVFRNPVQARDLLLEALEIQPLPSGHVYDGELDGRMVKLMPINRIATKEDLNNLISGVDYRAFEQRQAESPHKPVERITLICMGHEADLKATLEKELKPYHVDIEVVDILRDRQDLQFKRDSEAKLVIEQGQLVIAAFYPMNLLGKLSLQRENVTDWRELAESVMIDWNYDGGVFEPKTVDIPAKDDLVTGRYAIPRTAGTIRVKITDLLSESWEGEVQFG